jgi:hypothetical protein
MSALTDFFGKKGGGDGVMTTAAHAEYERSTGDSMLPQVPPPPPPPPKAPEKSQVGDIKRGNTEKLEALLMKNGLTKEQAQAKIREQGKATGVNYK